MQSLTLTIISGANRSGRLSVRVAHYIKDLLQDHPEVHEIQFLDVHEYNFPNYLDGSERSKELNLRVAEFSEKLWASDGVVLVSPEYNGGMAGSTKNVLDYFRKEYEKRPFGLVSVSSGSMGGINAMHQMVDFVSYVGGYLCNRRLLVSGVGSAFDDEGKVQSAQLERNAPLFVNDLVDMASKLKAANAVPHGI